MWFRRLVTRLLGDPRADVERDMAALHNVPPGRPPEGRSSLFGTHIDVNRVACPMTFLAHPGVPDTVRLDHGVLRGRTPDTVYTKDPLLARRILQNRIHPRPRRWAPFNRRSYAFSVPLDLIGRVDADDPMVSKLRTAYIQGLAAALERHANEIRAHADQWTSRVARGRVEVTFSTKKLAAEILHLLIYGTLPRDPVFARAFQIVGPLVRDSRRRLAHLWWPVLDRVPTPYAVTRAIVGHAAGWATRAYYRRYRHNEVSLIGQLYRQGLADGRPEFGWEAQSVLLSGAAIPAYPMVMMLFELAEQPALQERIVNEGLYGAAVKETLRLHPPVLTPGRVIRERVEGASGALDPMSSPEACLFVNIKGVHRHPRGWIRPDEFVIDRWLPGWPDDAEPAYHAYMPFGLGARSCITAAISPTILETFLRAVLSRRVVSNPSRQRPRLASGAVALVRHPFRLEFSDRHPGSR